jgi:hypothetical protein
MKKGTGNSRVPFEGADDHIGFKVPNHTLSQIPPEV